MVRALGGLGGWLGTTACASRDDTSGDHTIVVDGNRPALTWLQRALIVGADLSDTNADARPAFDAALASGASVIEGDSILSDYLSAERFDGEVHRIDTLARQCHERNLKLVWYYPALEIITNQGERADVPSAYKDHPDWVQRSLFREPNVFYGSKDFWVPPGAESAWLCHNSGYRDYFFERIRKLAGTALDGLWIDVPLFMDTVLRWACMNPACIDKFRVDTGLAADQLTEDWYDPAWRKWIYWRHEELTRFCMEIVAQAKQVNPEFEVVFETVTMDTDIATVQALDASFRTFELSKPLPSAASLVLPDRIDRVWELDSVSNDFGMRPGVHDDWLCKLRGAKFARGCDRPRGSWVFSYGCEEPDAGLVMSMLAATGCNPYETKTPLMTTTVGDAFRSRMFHFLQTQADTLFGSDSAATVGLLHSSTSRDYVDKGPSDTTFFVSEVNDTLNVGVGEVDPSFYEGGSIRDTTYCADYAGAFKALSHLHVPFDVVPLQTLGEADASALARFRLLVMPSVQCLSEAQVTLLEDYVRNGGRLLVCGPTPGSCDQFGAAKPDGSRFDQRLGFDAATGPTAKLGIVYTPDRIGKSYLATEDGAALDVFRTAVEAASAQLLVFEGSNPDHRHIHIELARQPNGYVLHFVNYSGAATTLKVNASATPGAYPFEQDYAIVRQDVNVELRIPETVKGARFLSPDVAFAAADAKWLGDGKLQLPVHQHTMVVLDI